ncbi:MAG: amidohydrolase family protein, partial [Erythrobacter sp.]
AKGEPCVGGRPKDRVTREQALGGFTSEAAYAGFAEGRFGRLRPGERADFVLSDRDPLLATPSELRATQVLETWVGGRKVYEAD